MVSNVNKPIPIEEFRYTDHLADTSFNIGLETLWEDENFEEFVQRIKEKLGSANNLVTASIFFKRYAFLAVIQLYLMSVHNKRFSLSFNNLSLVDDKGDLWLPKFYIPSSSLESLGNQNREEWREETIMNLFGHHMYPLMSRWIIKTKVSNIILWENIAIYIYWLYETALLEIEDEKVKARCNEDFHYLVNDAEGHLFGPYHRNPIKRYYHKKQFVKEHNQELRVRSTCCFSYLVTEGWRCKTYPQICKISNEGGI